MPDPTAATGQEPGAGASQADGQNGSTPTGTGTDTQASQAGAGTGAGTTTPTDTTGGMTLEQALSALSEARKEAASHRTKLREAEGRIKTFEDEKLSEQEKKDKAAKEAADRADRAETELRKLRLEAGLERAAAKAGITDTEAALRLLDPSKLDLDDDGRPKNAEDVLKAMLKDRPWLSGAAAQTRRPSADAGAGRGQGGTTDMNAILRRAAGLG